MTSRLPGLQVLWGGGGVGGHRETKVGGLVPQRKGFETGTHMFKKFLLGKKREKN